MGSKYPQGVFAKTMPKTLPFCCIAGILLQNQTNPEDGRGKIALTWYTVDLKLRWKLWSLLLWYNH